ncbi:hypothetical protein EJ076_15855 [Mesorhizobium sp. M7D.F.Ca.US.005.01.1.1]|nr:hypothetical protein EJ076_15855 [Mesorhizobium sp. M7D.F.Ca.US.005.01.1.1]
MAMYQQTQPRQNQSSGTDFIVQPAPIQYPTIAAPQVTPITPPGGNQVRCIKTGIYTNCRSY